MARAAIASANAKGLSTSPFLSGSAQPAGQLAQHSAHTGGTDPQGVRELLEAGRVVRDIYVDDRVKDYIVDVVFATREPKAKGMRSREGGRPFCRDIQIATGIRSASAPTLFMKPEQKEMSTVRAAT